MKNDNQLINFYEKIPSSLKKKPINPNYKIHGIICPFMMGIVGATGSMKSNTCLNLIHLFSNTFNHIVLVIPRDDEPLYEYLKNKIGTDNITIYNSLDEVPEPDNWEEYGQTLIIFDDLMNEKKQDIITTYFLRGRKVGLSCIYISQYYHAIPIKVRAQFHYLIMKQVNSKKDLTLILTSNSAINKDQLKNMYDYALDGDKTNFFLIDYVDEKKRYRKNFREFLNPNEFI
jgi:hypothetical protein